MNLKIEVFDSTAAFEVLKPEWNALLRNSTPRHLFVTWEWQSNWWTSYHPGDLWIITVRDQDADDELIALFPWFIHDLGEKGRLVRSIGCVDVTDYIEPLIKAGIEEAILEAVAEYVATQKHRYDKIDLCNIPASAPMLQIFPDMLTANGFDVIVKQQEVCPVIVLPESWESYLAMLDKKQRHELRRKMRRLYAVGYDWRYITAEDDLDAAMERFLNLMRTASPDKVEFLSDPQNVDFFKRVIPPMAAQGWLSLSFMQIEGKDAAAYLSFDYNNKILLYNSGQDHTVYGDLSTGAVLLGEIIKDAIETGHEVFDFLRGNEKYKYYMGGQDTDVMMLMATPTT